MDQQQSRWRPTRRQVLWAGGIVVVLAGAVLVGYRYGITLWDWLKLLVVPAVIAGGGIWFNRQQRERELEIAREQREREVEIAEQRTQDEALQAYLDQMSNMLIPNTDQPSLYKARPGDSVSSVTRARTLTVLSRLDGGRKGRVLQFLYESGLIAKRRPVLDLRGDDLSKTNRTPKYLSEAHLIGANLYGSYLNGIDLSGANLSGANLAHASLDDVLLRGANLSDAYMAEADLSRSYLGGANLSGANLSGANLNEAILAGARGWTDDQSGAAKSLRGAIMPNGQKYEDWLKDQEGRREDGENSGP